LIVYGTMRIAMLFLLMICLIGCQMPTPAYRATRTPEETRVEAALTPAVNGTDNFSTVPLMATSTDVANSVICRGAVNVREQPTRRSRWLASLEPGEAVEILRRSAGWILIRQEELQGWIYSQYVCEK
jgi:hypothetical protein